MRQIYLDYNSTTPIAPGVQEAMVPFLSAHFGDPASGHSSGRACAEAVEDARGQVAQILGADPEEIVFTSGGTESNNLAIKGVMLHSGPVGQGHLIISAIEHPSVAESARFLERMGFDVSIAHVSGQGVVQPSAIQAMLRSDTLLVSIAHANHEIGTLQPLRQIAELCHDRNVLLHTDASQSFGKVRTLVDELDVDLLTVSGHKCYAPKGVGALFLRKGVLLEPWHHGDGREGGLRAGMENVAGIVGLGAAAAVASRSLDDSQPRLEKLRNRLLAQLQRDIGDELIVHGRLAPQLPNTLCVSFPLVSAQELLARVPEICASTGAAWHSSTAAISPTLAAMGVSPEHARGTARFSLGWYTTEDEIERAASLLTSAWEALT